MADRQGYNVYSTRSITILKPLDEVYLAWRNPGTLVNFLDGAESVDVFDENHSRFTAEIQGKGCLSWESEIIEDWRDNAISWRTTGESEFDHAGAVRFRPTPKNEGTEVELTIRTHLLGGKVGNTFAKLLGRSPEDFVSRTLHNCKQLMETGEVATNKGPSGRDIVLQGEEGGEQ